MLKKIETVILKEKKYGLILVPMMIFSVIVIVYLTNGTHASYIHLIYIPIILSAYYWGGYAASIVAAISGILLGLVPLNVAEGIKQNTMSWIHRMIMLIIIGYLTGNLFKKLEELNEYLKDKELISDITGLYNTKKLFYDLTDLIEKGNRFTIISVKLTNIEGIGKYVDFNLVQKLIKLLISDMKAKFEHLSMYSSSDDELILILPDDCQYFDKIKDLVNKYSTAVKIDGFEVRMPLKAGIYNFGGKTESLIEIYNKSRVASEQGEINESGIYYYDVQIDNERKELYEIAGSLHKALNNNEFYLVYQPKINIQENKISGVEVLLRWDRGDKKPVGPGVFIDVAEKIGLIRDISKYVIENVIKQIKIWEKENISIRCSINLTAQELTDQELIEWAVGKIESHDIDRSMIEIEITERVLNKEFEKINKHLEYLREIGYKISIDDFGTGYNSLMMIGMIHYDVLKIDKFFLDRMCNFEDRELVRKIIDYVHVLDKKVVAEGVETEEQLNFLKEYGCDEVQGYYFSKPLLAEDFAKFYKEFYKMN